jgi:hypothetical protein
VAIGLAAGGIIFFRHHEKELVQRAQSSLPGPLLGAPLRARDVADGGSNIGASTMSVQVEVALAPKISVTT